MQEWHFLSFSGLELLTGICSHQGLIGRSQVGTMAAGIALNVMQTIALMGMMTALCRQILRGMSRERIHDRDCFSCTHVLSTLAKEHPGKILELYPLLDGSLMIACFVWQKRCLQFQWFIVLSRFKKTQKHGWYTSEKNMSPLCGCWRPKVSTNFNIIRNHACACKFHPRFCPCKIVIKNQCQVQATCDILWWHGIDSCKSRFSPLHNFAYASTWSIYIHFVCVKSFKSICSEWLWHMRPQQVFFFMVHPMRCIHIIHVAEVEWPAEMENTSSGRDLLKNVKFVLETPFLEVTK